MVHWWILGAGFPIDTGDHGGCWYGHSKETPISRTQANPPTLKILYHERDGKKMALSFKLCETMLFRIAQRRPSNRLRWSSNDLYFHFGRTRIPEASHSGGKSACMAFSFGLRTIFSVKVIEEERKGSDRQSSSDRWIEERRQKSLWVALD